MGYRLMLPIFFRRLNHRPTICLIGIHMEHTMGYSEESVIEALVRFISEAVLVLGAVILLGSFF